MADVPEYYDPYVGKVYGNILDYFDNPSYNLKLYMIDEASQQASRAEFGLATDNLIAPPQSTVILAQTGVTGTQIDDVEINSVITANDGPNAQTVKFSIIQPGAANFLDQIQMAKVYLNQPNVSTPVMYLEIRFQGYNESNLGPNEPEWDPDTGGDPVVIAGPWRYKMDITKISVSIDNTGSQYFFEATATAAYAYRDPIFKLPKTLTTIGKTITEHVEDLKTKLNEWHAEASASEVPDEIDFDLSKLVGVGAGGTSSFDLISDETLMTNSDGDAEDVNRPLNETYDAEDAVSRQEQLEESPTDTGQSPEITFDGDKVGYKEGTSIHDYFLTLLSMNEEYYSKISRKSEFENPEDESIDNDRAFITWFRMNADVEQLKFDKSRNEYAHKYTFIPTLYKSSRRDVAVDVKETQVENGRKIVDELIGNKSLLKAYHYMFTGLNDQILGLDIRYDRGLALLVPPKYGAIGDVSVTASEQLANTVPEDKDLSLAGQIQDLFNKGKEAVEKDIIGGFFDELNKAKDKITGGIDGLVSGIADFTGKSVSEIAGFINNSASADAKAFVEQLDAATRRALASGASNPSPTVDPNLSPPEYNPEVSGYAYGADFLIPGVTYPDVQKLEDLGYINLQDKLPADPAEAVELKQGVTRTQDMPSKVDNATYKAGSAQNKLFGFVAGQHADKTFMLEIDLNIKGDPWYLGGGGAGVDAIGESTPEAANYTKDDNLFWLNIGAPLTYDPDFTDEDSELNSGYWDMSGESRTFGGAYRMIKVTNKFSRGNFTCQLKAQRILGPEKVERVSPGGEASTPETGNGNSNNNGNRTTPTVPADGEGMALPPDENPPT